MTPDPCRVCKTAATVTTTYVWRDVEVTHRTCDRHTEALRDDMIVAGWTQRGCCPHAIGRTVRLAHPTTPMTVEVLPAYVEQYQENGWTALMPDDLATATPPEEGHQCGRDFDPSCSGCVTAMSDAYGSDRSKWGR